MLSPLPRSGLLRHGLAMLLAILAAHAVAGDVIDFYAPPSEVGEGAGSAGITVTRSGTGAGAVSVTYATSDFGAHAGTDYTDTHGTLSWASGDLAPKTIVVPIIDNSTWQNFNERFKLTLSAPTGGATLGSTSITITIDDNDPNPAGILSMVSEGPSGAITVMENAGNVAITVVRGGSAVGAVSADIGLTDLTATAGVDYQVPGALTLSWLDGESGPKTVLVPIVDNAIPQPSRMFSAYINPGTLVGSPSLSNSSGANVIIIDDDAPSAGVLSLPTSIGVVENAGTASIIVHRAGGSHGAVSVDYATADGSASAGSDYQTTSGTLTWADGDSSPRTIAIPIINDSVPELTEWFTVSFSNPGGGLLMPDLPYNYVQVTIVDDDASAGVVGFSNEQYDVSEGVGQALITVMRSGGATGAISVDYQFTDGSAVSPTDYTAANGTLHWADGDAAPKTIAVPVVDNSVVDGGRAFYLQLANPVGGVLITDDLYLTTVVIHDNDGPAPSVLALTQRQVLVSENAGQIQFTVTRTGSAVGAVTLPYSIQPGTAHEGSDYLGEHGSVAWADGDSASKTITVPIIDNNVVDGSRYFRVGISAPSGGAVVGDINQVICIITDDEVASAGTLRFTTPTASAGEDAGSLAFQVSRDGGASGAVTVMCSTFTTSDDAARPGTDFIPTLATLSWADGDSAPKTFTVPINDDHQPGVDRTFEVRLSSPTGGAVLDASHGQPTAIGTILERDPAPNGILWFSTPTFSVNENAGNAVITVSRRGGATGAVSAHCFTAAASALDGLDFSPVDVRLSWADGDAADKTITVPIIDDALVEGDETFYVFLDNPAGGALIGAPYAIVTIHDDEVNPAGQLQFTAAITAVDDQAGTVQIHVARSGGSAGAVSVPWTITDLTTTEGSDYTAAMNGVLSWSAGDGADQTIAIAVLPRTRHAGLKSAQLALGTPSGGATLGQSAAELDITDPAPADSGSSSKRCGRGHFFSLILLGLLGLRRRSRRW